MTVIWSPVEAILVTLARNSITQSRLRAAPRVSLRGSLRILTGSSKSRISFRAKDPELHQICKDWHNPTKWRLMMMLSTTKWTVTQLVSSQRLRASTTCLVRYNRLSSNAIKTWRQALSVGKIIIYSHRNTTRHSHSQQMIDLINWPKTCLCLRTCKCTPRSRSWTALTHRGDNSQCH